MNELSMTLNVKCEYKPDEKNIILDIFPINKTRMEVVLKSELFREVSRSGGLLHVEP